MGWGCWGTGGGHGLACQQLPWGMLGMCPPHKGKMCDSRCLPDAQTLTPDAPPPPPNPPPLPPRDRNRICLLSRTVPAGANRSLSSKRTTSAGPPDIKGPAALRL